MNRHDYFRPDCPKMKMVLLGTHSNGTRFYYCKNCRYGGREISFTEEYDPSETLRQVLQDPW